MTVRVMVVVLGDGNGGGDVGGSGTGSATTRVLARRSCGTQKLAMCSGLKLFAPGSWFVLMTFSVYCCWLDHSVNGKTDMPMSTTFTQCFVWLHVTKASVARRLRLHRLGMC